MPKITPFNGYLVAAGRARAVVSPAYDSVSPRQRRKFAEENPDNFLNTMRLLEDFPPDAQITSEDLLNFNKDNLDRLLSNGSYNEFEKPCIFIYRLDTGEHEQTGVVCEVPVSEYEMGFLRKHENTHGGKEDLLTDYQKVMRVSSSPICLTYSQNKNIDDCVGSMAENEPDLEFTSEDGVRQKIWRIESREQQDHLADLFAGIDITYLTDGHHRAASGRRYAEMMRKEKGNAGDEPYNKLLVALFPDNQLNLLPFHRCVKDLNNKSEDEIVDELKKCFAVSRLDNCNDFEAARHGEFGMHVNGRWYRLNVKPEYIDADDPVRSLDVTILQNLILAPVLGIRDMRTDKRLDYVAGVGGSDAIEQKCSEGWEILFTCYPTSIDQLMNVADANALMPPKSTYFDPKPRSGIFVRLK